VNRSMITYGLRNGSLGQTVTRRHWATLVVATLISASRSRPLVDAVTVARWSPSTSPLAPSSVHSVDRRQHNGADLDALTGRLTSRVPGQPVLAGPVGDRSTQTVRSS